MKHIFIVHSHITYIASLAVVIHENLANEDVIFISDGYSLPVNHYKVIPVIVNQSCFPKWKLISRAKVFLSPIRYLYPIIESHTNNEKFVAYISVFHKIKKYVIAHPQCAGFHFIEEGLSSYYENFSLDFYTMENPYPWFYDKGIKGVKQRFNVIMDCLGTNIPKFESIPLFYKPYIDDEERRFYGLSDFSFPNVTNRIIIPIREVAERMEITEHIQILSDRKIWIGDPDIMAVVGENFYYECLKKIIPSITQGDKLSVRFHYRETNGQRVKFMGFLDSIGVAYEIIDDSQIMEFVLLKSTNCKLYGVNSSLLIYAKILGQQSYSVLNYFPEFKNVVEKQIPVFKKLVNYI